MTTNALLSLTRNGGRKMRCPVDSTELKKTTYKSQIEIDQCPSCSGIWLDYGELESIQDCKRHDYSEELAKIPEFFDQSYKFALAKKEGTYSCPCCAKEMEKREYGLCSQIVIDVCPSCRGVWLHKDEIAELETFFEKCRFEAADIRQGMFKSFLLLFK